MKETLRLLGFAALGFAMVAPILAAPVMREVPAPRGIEAYPQLVGFNCQASPYVAFAPEEDEFPGTCDAIFNKDEVCVTDASLDWLTPRECEAFLRGEYAL